MKRLGRISEGRSLIYYWFAQALVKRPTPEEVARTMDDGLLDTLEEVLDGEANQVIEELRAYARLASSSRADELGRAFDELFVVPVPGRYVPPYESCFREAAHSNGRRYGELWGRATAEVKGFYRSNGLETTAENVPPDHVGVEFLFMSKMCEQEARALWKGEDQLVALLRQEEARFLQEHLCAWLPSFAERLRALEDASFYPHLVTLAEKFVERDIEYLKPGQDVGVTPPP